MRGGGLDVMTPLWNDFFFFLVVTERKERGGEDERSFEGYDVG